MMSIKLGNKAQYQPRSSFSSVHPILIIGIAVVILPYIIRAVSDVSVFMFNTSQVIGIMLILVGSAFSIFNASN